MRRWERLEDYLFEYDLAGGEFTVHDYADHAGLERSEASGDIQSYLSAQRAPKSRTLFVLRRQPGTRTRNAHWAVGVKAKDARMIGKALHSDVRCRVMRAFRPDLVALKAHNPRQAAKVEQRLEAVIDHVLPLMELAAVDGSE